MWCPTNKGTTRPRNSASHTHSHTFPHFPTPFRTPHLEVDCPQDRIQPLLDLRQARLGSRLRPFHLCPGTRSSLARLHLLRRLALSFRLALVLCRLVTQLNLLLALLVSVLVCCFVLCLLAQLPCTLCRPLRLFPWLGGRVCSSNSGCGLCSSEVQQAGTWREVGASNQQVQVKSKRFRSADTRSKEDNPG